MFRCCFDTEQSVAHPRSTSSLLLARRGSVGVGSARGSALGVDNDSSKCSLTADPWAAAEPSSKLVALRRELLTSQRAAEGA
jgi:hypothetical protein